MLVTGTAYVNAKERGSKSFSFFYQFISLHNIDYQTFTYYYINSIDCNSIQSFNHIIITQKMSL